MGLVDLPDSFRRGAKGRLVRWNMLLLLGFRLAPGVSARPAPPPLPPDIGEAPAGDPPGAPAPAPRSDPPVTAGGPGGMRAADPAVLAAWLGAAGAGTWVEFEARLRGPEEQTLLRFRVVLADRSAGEAVVRVRTRSGSAPASPTARPQIGPDAPELVVEWVLPLGGGPAVRRMYDPDREDAGPFEENEVAFKEAVGQIPGIEGVMDPGEPAGEESVRTPAGTFRCRRYQSSHGQVWTDPSRPLGGLVQLRAREPGGHRMEMLRIGDGTKEE